MPLPLVNGSVSLNYCVKTVSNLALTNRTMFRERFLYTELCKSGVLKLL